MTTYIQQYSDLNLIPTEEDEEIAKLEQAAQQLAEELANNKNSLPNLVILIATGTRKETASAFDEVLNVIKTKWKVFGRKTPEESYQTLYIVLLEALRVLIETNPSLASSFFFLFNNIWKKRNHSTQPETCLIDFEKKLSLSRHNESLANWSFSATDKVKKVLFEASKVEASLINYDKLKDDLYYSVLKNADDPQNSNGYDISDNFDNWADDFSQLAASAIQEAFSNFAERYQAVFVGGIQKIAAEATGFGPSIIGRLQMLWWKEALYSVSFNQSYRELGPVVSILSMATDLANICENTPPTSVDFLLQETYIRAFATNAIDSKSLVEWVKKLKESKVDYSFLKSTNLYKPAVGKLMPLVRFIIGFLNEDGYNLAEMEKYTGFEKDMKVTGTELLVWLFHDLIGLKLLSRISIPTPKS